MTAELKNPHATMTNWLPSVELLPDGITFSDLDGIMERKGHFLVVESKYKNENIGKGQLIMLSQLSKLPQFNVFMVHMDKATGLVEDFYYLNNGVSGTQYFGHEKWVQIVKRWWDKANG